MTLGKLLVHLAEISLIGWSRNGIIMVFLKQSHVNLIEVADSNFYKALTQLCLRSQLFLTRSLISTPSYYFTFIFNYLVCWKQKTKTKRVQVISFNFELEESTHKTANASKPLCGMHVKLCLINHLNAAASDTMLHHNYFIYVNNLTVIRNTL